MKILFDVGHQAEAHSSGREFRRAGIYRVADQLARGLIASERCDVRLCAPLPLRAAHGLPSYLETAPELAAGRAAFPLRRAAFYHALRDRSRSLRASGRVPWLLRAAGTVAIEGARRVLEMAGTGPARSDLDWAEVYHTPCYTFSPAVRASSRLKKVITVHDLIASQFREFSAGDRIVGPMLEKWHPEDWALCISRATRDALCEHLKLDGSRALVIPWAASAEVFHPVADPGRLAAVRLRHGIPDGPYVVGLNTLEPRKNIAHLVRCFLRLIRQEAIPDLHLVLVGAEGWLFDGIHEAVGRSGALRGRITLTGYVPNADLAPLLSGAALFVSVSHWEGFGLPLLEAMQCGTPVIASDVAAHPEVVGEAGLLVPPRDEDALCAAMLGLFRDSSLRARLAASGLARSREFSWSRCVRETVDAYERVRAS